ncbi:hypothetical protein M8542_15835 [Amycolatopsis sp. OK19-0408]|uniref:Uncharacterized protein n=1 Tax=Amycolatopsis iheyensis TaxID=2945988 RepID=A0A9X2NBL4_9PSEU|nr:hypothetical protein [Amycolatopsis iheyensis]MCR6484293.1 hypothetical protein [Amycolatopsis iheyensis]
METTELLRRATDLIPDDARSDAGLTAADVHDYLREDEWEVALSILEDFDGIEWQTVEYWNLLAEAANQMFLARRTAWCQWRGWETRHGIIRADLQLVAPEAGGRLLPIPGEGVLRPMWAFGGPGVLHIAKIWVESAPEIEPGGRGSVRLAPLTPPNWRHLTPGDSITMHERPPVAGTATIVEVRHPRTADTRRRLRK